MRFSTCVAPHLYFGYGSNMSRSSFINFKNIQPLSIYRGIIKNMSLSFSVQSKGASYCVGNVEQSNNIDLHGCIATLHEKDMEMLTRLEYLYDRRIVSAEYYPEDIEKYKLPNKPVEVEIFIHDASTQQSLSNDINFVNDGSGMPTKNYLETIINGAQELQLYPSYIKQLREYPYIEPLQFNPTVDQWKLINNKLFTMKDIENKNNKLCVCKGIIFDISNSPNPIMMMCIGKDITFDVVAKRWAFFVDNFQDLKCITDIMKYCELQQYINDQVQQLLNGLFRCKVIGKLEDYEPNNLASYEW